jgi:hypothetical protein
MTALTSGDSSSTLASNREPTFRESPVDSERGNLDQSTQKETKGSGLPSEKKALEDDPSECKFDGPDDPEDPLNIPFYKKWLAVGAVGTGAICV